MGVFFAKDSPEKELSDGDLDQVSGGMGPIVGTFVGGAVEKEIAGFEIQRDLNIRGFEIQKK